jgi:hypothetical protein
MFLHGTMNINLDPILRTYILYCTWSHLFSSMQRWSLIICSSCHFSLIWLNHTHAWWKKRVRRNEVEYYLLNNAWPPQQHPDSSTIGWKVGTFNKYKYWRLMKLIKQYIWVPRGSKFSSYIMVSIPAIFSLIYCMPSMKILKIKMSDFYWNSNRLSGSLEYIYIYIYIYIYTHTHVLIPPFFFFLFFFI